MAIGDVCVFTDHHGVEHFGTVQWQMNGANIQLQCVIK
jgi:hypothetical protein